MRLDPSLVSIHVDGRRLNAATWGDTSAPAVMLIHGIRDHCRSWDAIAHKLAQDFHIIAPDLRGHGDSDWTGADSYYLAAYAADIADVARAFDLSRYAIIGHSLGGAIGLRVAAAFPDKVKAFVGIECVELPIQRDEAENPTPFPQRMRHWLERRRAFEQKQIKYYPTAESAAARMRAEQPDLLPETIQHLARHAIALEPGKGWRWKFDPRVGFRAPDDQRGLDLNDILDAVSCPALLAYGDMGDIPLPGEARLAHLRSLSISRFSGGGHWLHHQFTERFTNEALQFLNDNFRIPQYA